MPPADLRPWYFTFPSDIPREAASLWSSYVRVDLLQLHDGTAWEIEALLRTAAARLDLTVDIIFHFTLAKHTDDREFVLGHAHEPLRHMLTLSKSGDVSVDEFARWIQDKFPSDNLLVCSEPFFLCPLLHPKRMLAVFNMALLNEFLFPDATSLREWWSYWTEFRSAPNEIAIACRLTQHQVYAQTGETFPYVPFIAIHVDVQGTQTRPEVLLFRNNRQALLAFRMALRIVDRTLLRRHAIVDMNDLPRLSFDAIAAFHAVILLPHVPNALRLTDVYKTFRPIFVPDSMLAQKYVWANRNYCGYDADAQYRHVFQAPPTPAPYNPMFYYQWSIHAQWEHRRYWYQYTEWATLPGLLSFSSIHDLLDQIEKLDRHDELRTIMQRHHAKASADVLHWWTRAVAKTLL